MTSPINCEDKICGFVSESEGMPKRAMVLNETTKVTTVRLGKCVGDLKILAVGAGG